MMKTMSEQFAQLAMSNREKGVFPSHSRGKTQEEALSLPLTPMMFGK